MIARESVSGEPGGLRERIDEFARFLRREDRSPATIRAYEWGLLDLWGFLKSRGVTGLEQISRADLEAWQDRLLAVHMRPRTRSLAGTAARQFFKWAADHDYCSTHLASWLATVRLRPLRPKPIPPADLDRLLSHFARRSTDLQELRNRALFIVFLTTGVRVSEGLQLRRDGYERAEVRQKGGGEKLVTMTDHAQGLVREYLAARSDSSPWLFVTHPAGRRMTPGGVRAVWQKVTRELGIAPFTTHQIRHTFATQLLAQGIDSRVVAEMMGHKGMQSIMGYTQVMEPDRQRAMKAIEQVIDATAPAPPADPRALTKPSLTSPKRRGRPRFRIVR